MIKYLGKTLKIKKINLGVLTSSRADYGKLKPIIFKLSKNKKINLSIFATGMHLFKQMGLTVNEIKKNFGSKCISVKGQIFGNNQLDGFVNLLKNIKLNKIFKRLDYIIIHGDRIEALALTIAAKLNNCLVIHIEGGELSGSIDERIRHSITKFSDFHLVSNLIAKKRVLQLGEEKNRIWVTGSPEASIILGNNLPSIESVKKRYNIVFKNYIILTFHPVVNNFRENKKLIKLLRMLLKRLKYNIITIGCNTDNGYQDLLKNLSNFTGSNVKYFPSIRFEYYLSLLKHASFVIGNSSSFVREAPALGVPSIIPGTRQFDRITSKNVIYVKPNYTSVINEIKKLPTKKSYNNFFGGKEAVNLIEKSILKILKTKINYQKKFKNV
jgi:UDP-N-acetylglucosamine 2-epimerase (hydrolysing)